MVVERTQALQEAQEELFRKEKLAIIGELAGSVAHELRNPLGVISNSVYYLNMLLTDSDKSSQDVHNSLALITEAVQRLKKSDLLDFSRGQVSESQTASITDLVEARSFLRVKRVKAPCLRFTCR